MSIIGMIFVRTKPTAAANPAWYNHICSVLLQEGVGRGRKSIDRYKWVVWTTLAIVLLLVANLIKEQPQAGVAGGVSDD
ncbi:MAG TPA: hypothetical protein DDZ53_05275 [Firmicutes bacterium]|nr:hypothetical protein [Bacillota bacterium]